MNGEPMEGCSHCGEDVDEPTLVWVDIEGTAVQYDCMFALCDDCLTSLTNDWKISP